MVRKNIYKRDYLPLARPNAGESLVSRSRSSLTPAPNLVYKGGLSFTPNMTYLRGGGINVRRGPSLMRGYY